MRLYFIDWKRPNRLLKHLCQIPKLSLRGGIKLNRALGSERRFNRVAVIH